MPTLKDPKVFHFIDTVFHLLVGIAAMLTAITAIIPPKYAAIGAAVYAAINLAIRLIKQYVPEVEQ